MSEPEAMIERPDIAAFAPVSFEDLPGWAEDAHAAALHAFSLSVERLPLDRIQSLGAWRGGAALSASAIAELRDQCAAHVTATPAECRRFFEQHFQPFEVIHGAKPGFVTGYYEPVIQASRTPTADYVTPILERPADLVNVVAETARGATVQPFTHLRQTASGLVPYLTRREIEAGGLAGQDLELFYLRDTIELFFLQVQGSGRCVFDDGTSVRVTYDGKNGHAYTSIGRYLIEQNLVDVSEMTLEVLVSWLRAHPEVAQHVMWENKSYVFFRALKDDEIDAPQGVLGTPLMDGRSLAVDTTYHTLGLPVYVSVPGLIAGSELSDRSQTGFHRLMIAQDVGSAIKGPERGDIYFGSGAKAGALAGRTKHDAKFWVLLPRDRAP
jgi:membrane-bound lytic murein transglycosylase A